MKRTARLLVVILLSLTSLLKVPIGHALTNNSVRDFDSNAVISGGVSNCSDIQTGFQNNDVANIFNQFGISNSDINNICNTSIDGVVTNRNNVWIHRSSGLCPDIDQTNMDSQTQLAIQNNPNLCLVATNAMTAGRQNIAGSSAISNNGTTFFMRSPSTSFATSSLPAFVVMKNGQFAFAIIASCGNPVTATPVMIKRQSNTQISNTKVTRTPTSTSSSANANASATVNVTTPAVQAATTTTSVPAQPVAAVNNTALPNTGPGDLAAVFGVSTVFGTIGHWLYSRRRIS